MDNPTSQVQQPLHPTGERMHRIAGAIAETDLVERALAMLYCVVVGESLHACEMPYVLRRAKRGIQRERLRHQPQQPSQSSRVALSRLTIDKNMTAIGFKDSRKNRQRRGLARAVGSEQGGNFTWPYCEAYIIKRKPRAVTLRNLDGLEKWCL